MKHTIEQLIEVIYQTLSVLGWGVPKILNGERVLPYQSAYLDEEEHHKDSFYYNKQQLIGYHPTFGIMMIAVPQYIKNIQHMVGDTPMHEYPHIKECMFFIQRICRKSKDSDTDSVPHIDNWDLDDSYFYLPPNWEEWEKKEVEKKAKKEEEEAAKKKEEEEKKKQQLLHFAKKTAVFMKTGLMALVLFLCGTVAQAQYHCGTGQGNSLKLVAGATASFNDMPVSLNFDFNVGVQTTNLFLAGGATVSSYIGTNSGEQPLTLLPTITLGFQPSNSPVTYALQGNQRQLNLLIFDSFMGVKGGYSFYHKAITLGVVAVFK